MEFDCKEKDLFLLAASGRNLLELYTNNVAVVMGFVIELNFGVVVFVIVVVNALRRGF